VYNAYIQRIEANQKHVVSKYLFLIYYMNIKWCCYFFMSCSCKNDKIPEYSWSQIQRCALNYTQVKHIFSDDLNFWSMVTWFKSFVLEFHIIRPHYCMTNYYDIVCKFIYFRWSDWRTRIRLFVQYFYSLGIEQLWSK